MNQKAYLSRYAKEHGFRNTEFFVDEDTFQWVQEFRRNKRRQLTQAQRRMKELDRLFKRLYKDNISGKINDNRFEKLSADYENEQAELTEKLLLLEQELTPAVLHNLVNKVYVCAPDKSSGHRVRNVNISLACIGFLAQSILSEMVNHAAKNRTA